MRSKKPKSGRVILDVSLAGTPELEQFETEEQRQQALSEISKEAGNPRTGNYWLAVVILVFSVLAAGYAADVLLHWVVWPNWVEDVLGWGFRIAAFLLVLRSLHRWGSRVELRQKLLAAGVPVCLSCGYSLRGLAGDSERCPECGTRIPESVSALTGSKWSAGPRPAGAGDEHHPQNDQRHGQHDL